MANMYSIHNNFKKDKKMDIYNIKFPVLDKGYVELINTMPLPSQCSLDLSVVNAARTSYLGESKGEDKDKRLLNYLIKNKHMSPLEQVEFQFKIKAPLMVWIHILRHRTAHLNMQSGRYVQFDESEYYNPTEWRLQSQDNKQGSSGEILSLLEQSNIISELGYSQDSLADLFNIFSENCYRIYENLVRNGVAKEQARLFLPAYALYFEGVWKIDARNLFHFINLRTEANAQFETREFADTMHNILKELMPWTCEAFELYGNKD